RRHRVGPEEPAAQSRVLGREAYLESERNAADVPHHAESWRLEQRRQSEPQPGPAEAIAHNATERRGRSAAGKRPWYYLEAPRASDSRGADGGLSLLAHPRP